jgi:PAS domain S-box-containing protein
MADAPAKRAYQVPDFQLLFEQVRSPYIVLDIAFTIVAVNDAHLRATLTSRDEVLGRNLFDVFPENPGESEGAGSLRASLMRALGTGKTDQMPILRYDVKTPDGGFEERYWDVVNTPIAGPDGLVRWILNSAEDATELMKLRGEFAAWQQTHQDRRGLTEQLQACQREIVEKTAEIARLRDARRT